MRKFFSSFKGAALGLTAALVATVALGVTTQQFGWNPTTGLNGVSGLQETLGVTPSASTSTCSSGSVTVVGGPNTGKLTTATCTTLVPVLVWTFPALGEVVGSNGSGYSQSVWAPTINGAWCSAYDVTHVADNTASAAPEVVLGVYVAATATAAGTLTCTFPSMTITAADVLLYNVQVF